MENKQKLGYYESEAIFNKLRIALIDVEEQLSLNDISNAIKKVLDAEEVLEIAELLTK